MTEITDLSVTDSSNTEVTGESLDGSIANMGRMDNTLQAVMGLLARSIRTNVLRFLDNTDPTKKVKLDLSGLPTATERTWTAPYYSGTLGLVSDIRGQIYGLTLSNNVTDATNDIDIAAGSAVDSTGAVSMLLAAGLTKQLDAVWAVGTNAGMRASGAAIANTTYHIFEIRRPDTGVVDIAADTSVTGANIAANTNVAYTQIRRIGSIIRSAGVIIPFKQNGDEFALVNQIGDVDATSAGAAAVLRTLTVPSGLSVVAFGNGWIAASGINTYIVLTDPALGDTVPGTGAVYACTFSIPASLVGGGEWQCRTNTSSQIRTRGNNATGDVLRLSTKGWIDTRGRT